LPRRVVLGSSIDDPDVVEPHRKNCVRSAWSGGVTIGGWGRASGIMQRQKEIIYAELHSASRELVQLLADWSSCVRFAYALFRDGMMFVRADLTKSGNPGLLVKNTEAGFHLEVFIGNSGFLDRDSRSFLLSVPNSAATRLSGLLASGAPYNVRIHRKEINKYK